MDEAQDEFSIENARLPLSNESLGIDGFQEPPCVVVDFLESTRLVSQEGFCCNMLGKKMINLQMNTWD